MKRPSRRLFSLVTAGLLAGSAALGTGSAQSAALGGISGIVRDTTNAVVSGANVTVINTQTGAVRTLTTDSEGHYAATFLQPGIYEVILGGGTFGKVDQKNVNVQVGDTRTVDATLPLADVSTQVVVTSDAPLIDADKVASSQTVSEELVQNLPVNGRRFDNFVLLTPNVIPDGNSGLLSFRGISGIYNSNIVDGANNNQAFFSEARGRSIGAPYVYPIDAIKEFSAETAAYSAEFGQAAGGIINAITKSGGNQFHGDAYEYYRTPGYNALDPLNKYNGRVANNPLLLNQPVKVQHQFGVSFGGPIVHDRLFYHFTYDGYRKVNPITYLSAYNSTVNPATGTVQNIDDLTALCDGRTSNYLTRGTAAAPVIYPSVITGVTPAQCSAAVQFITNTQLGSFQRNVTQDVYFPRLDYQVTDRTHLSASFLFENFQQPNGYNSSATVTGGGVSQNGTANFHERFLVINAETALGAHSANVVHLQFSRDLETDSTNSGGPANTITGIAAYGETSALPRGAFPDEHRYQATDIYSTVLGRHSLKAGFDVNIIHEQIQNLFQGDGSFTYGTGTNEFNFTNWVQDVYGVNGGRHYNSFTQVNDPITGVGADDFYNQDIDGFIEDSWKVAPKFLLSLGARYDVQLVPQPDRPNLTSGIAQLSTSVINNYKGMIQPRVGFSFNPQEGTVVRGGYGIFYGLNSNSTYYTIRRENGVYQQQFNVNALTNPNAPYVAATAAGSGQPNRRFVQSGTYTANAPQGGVPEFTPPGPSPTNQVTGAANPAVNTGLALSTVSARGLSPDFQNPESMSYDLTVEQQLPLHSTLTVAYVGNRATRLPVFVDANVDPTSAALRTYFYYATATSAPQAIAVPYYTRRQSNNSGSVLVGYSDVNASYNSLVFTVRKPISNGIEVLANYTWSKSLDGGQVSGVNGTFNGTDVPFDPVARGHRQGRGAEYGKSDLDERGRFVGSLVATPTIDRVVNNAFARTVVDGFSISGTFTAQTGEPLTGFMSNSPVSVIGDGGLTGAELSLNNAGTPGRLPSQIAARNSFRGPGVHNLDARVERTFKLGGRYQIQLLAEAFNVVNHHNILAVSTAMNTFITPGTTSSTLSGSVTCPTGASAGCIVPLSSTSSPFGTPTSTSSVLYTPRQLQLAGKFYF